MEFDSYNPKAFEVNMSKYAFIVIVLHSFFLVGCGNSKIQELENEASELRTQLADAQNQIAELESKIEEAKSKATSIESELSSIDLAATNLSSATNLSECENAWQLQSAASEIEIYAQNAESITSELIYELD